jgi:hypothetical protein
MQLSKTALNAIKKFTKKVNVNNFSGFGMWADRKDIKDVDSHIRELRKPRFKF